MSIQSRDKPHLITDQYGRFRSACLISCTTPTVGAGDDGFLWIDIGVDGMPETPVLKVWDDPAATWRAVPGGITGLANPSAQVGLAAINGVATTAIRSDGAPALSQAIAPTWTGAHLFKKAADSVTGWQVQDQDGNVILNVDSVNKRLGIGTASPVTALQVVGSANDEIVRIASLGTLSIIGGGYPLFGSNVYSYGNSFDFKNVLANANVGMGFISPMRSVASTEKGGIYVHAGNAAADQVVAWSDFTPVMVWDLSGRVGIGTATPNNPLSIKGAGTGIVGIGQLSTATQYGAIAFTPGGAITTANYALASSGASTLINAPTGSEINFRINNANKVVIDTNGNVGIGTAAPIRILHAIGDVIRIDRNGNAPGVESRRLDITADESYIRGDNTWGLSDASTERMYAGFGTVLASDANGAEYADYNFRLMRAGTLTEVMRIKGTGNVLIGGTAARAGTVGTKVLNIFDGTAPVGALANGCSIYSTAGELYAMDAAGNATIQTPHNKRGEWIFLSKNTVTGKVLEIDMEKMMKALNKQFGWDFIREYQA